ncbi:MAG TPA: DUF2339 domain-containing protein [Bryobacteraceae bacterium]|nr:DUF2339 domain-containing protein [Bryobacteraceae bacterium]
MADSDQQRLDAIVQVLIRIQQDQRVLSDRLARLEGAAGFTAPVSQSAAQPATPEAPPPFSSVPPEAAEVQPAPPMPGPAPAPTPPPHVHRSPELETRMGLTWINRIGVVTLVLGVAFFFKYAVDNRWIGEGGRVALGVLAGLALLAGADRLWHRGQRVFAQGITGAGIAVLFVAFYAAFGFYSLISQPAAFGLMLLNTAAAIVLSLRYGSQAIAALGLVGGFMTPVVLSTGQDAPWFFLGYVLLLAIGAATLAWRRRWRLLDGLAFAAAFILFAAWIGQHFTTEKRLVAIVFALAYYALFATREFRPVSAMAPAAACVLLLAISVPGPYPFLLLAPVVIATAMAIADARSRPEMLLAAFAAFWATYGLGQFDFVHYAARGTLTALLALPFALFLMWAPWRAGRGAAIGGIGLIVAPLNAAFFYAGAYVLLRPGWNDWLGLFTVALAAVHFALARWLWSAARSERLLMLMYTGVALALVTLAIPVQFAGFRITMAWALEAAALAWVAARTRDERLQWISTAVFALAFLRLSGDDAGLAVSVTLLNLRFLTFAVVAVCLGLSAQFGRRWAGAVVLYFGAHGVLLWGLVLEVLGWASRVAAPQDVVNFQSAAVSILLAAYAVLLVAIGVGTRSALNRIFGLVLIGSVVAKLYLYDVWRINRGIYRVAAFAGLGVFLLLMSYLYSRFRGSIEAFWRDEESRT